MKLSRVLDGMAEIACEQLFAGIRIGPNKLRSMSRKATQLEAINADLLEALIMLVADYEEIGGEAFYDDSYKQAKQAIRKATA